MTTPVLDTAAVRVQLDTKAAVAAARRVGERIGRRLTDGINKAVGRATTNLPPVQIPTEYATPRTPPVRPPTATIPTEYGTPANRLPPAPPVRVPLDPLTDAFRRQVTTEVARISRVVTAEVPLTARGERFRAQVAAQVAEITRQVRAEIPVDPEQAAEFRRKLAAQVQAVSRSVRSEIRVDVDSGTLTRLGRVTGLLRGLVGLGAQTGQTFTAGARAATGFGGVLTRVFGGGAASASDFGTQLSSAVARGGQSFGMAAAQVAAQVTQLTAKLSVFAAGIGFLMGAATAAVGAVTAAVAGLPVVLATVAAPIAAVVIGFEGIGRAAKRLKPAVDQLRVSLENTFEREFGPVFDRLGAVFPVLERGLTSVAVSTARFAGGLVDVVTSSQGLENLERALQGSGVALDRMLPAVQRLLGEFLAIAGTNDLYVIFGDTVGGLTDRFTAMLTRMRESGLLVRSLEQLRDVLISAADAVFRLAEQSTAFFTTAGPGLTTFFDGLSTMVGNIDFGRMGADFGRIMAALGEGLANVPPETWDRLAGAVGRFATAMQTIIDARVIDLLVVAFTGLVDSASLLVTTIATLAEPFALLLEQFGLLGSGVEETTTKLTELGTETENTGGLFSTFGEQLALFAANAKTNLDLFIVTTTEGIKQLGVDFLEFFQSLPTQVELFLSQLPERAGYWVGYMATTMALTASEAVNSVITALSALPGQVEGLVADMSGRAIRFFSALPGQLSSLAQQTVSQVVGAVSPLPGQLGSLASQAVNQMVGVLRGLPGQASSLASQTVSQVIGAFQGLGSALYQAGVSAVDGFVNGIRSAAGRAVAAARSVVSSAIAGARDALASHSPSLVFRDLGHDTLDGYIIGLKDRIAALLTNVRAIMSKVVAQSAGTTTGQRMIQAEDGTWVPESFYATTRNAVGSGTPPGGSDLATLTAALAAVLRAADWRITGDDLVLTVNAAGERLARR